MQVGIAQCVNKGMQRDYSMDKSSQEFAYENRNIRITTTGNNSFLSVTNENSTKKIPISYKDISEYLYVIDKINNRIIFSKEFSPPKPLNIRITYEDGNTEDSTLYSWVWPHSSFNQSANGKIVSVESLDSKYTLKKTNNMDELFDGVFELSTILGSTTINDYLVVFSKGESGKDFIYKIKINADTNKAEATLLFKGDLNFNIENPIECIAAYESKDVQKVYWVDGFNQPRYINIAVDNPYNSNAEFNFTPLLNNKLDVTITKQYNGTGEFTSGVIQYFITLYKEYGAESNLAYESSLYYISPKDRGGDIGEKQTCSFSIKIVKNINLRVLSTPFFSIFFKLHLPLSIRH